jgi:enoyl-CoA hydratase/carnithine racemase
MSSPIASGAYQAPAGWVGELCTYTRNLPGANPHIAAITYNRPDSANAINLEMREDINSSWATFR